MNNEQKALEILRELDLYARNYDEYEYGLPNYSGKEQDEMVYIILEILTK